MCFSSQAAAPVNPAPYSLANSASQVTQTQAPVNPPGSTTDNAISPAAVAADAKDKPTPPVTSYTVTSGLSTATM